MLNRQDILRLIQKKRLIENYIDLEKQVTPNGFDLTVGAVFTFAGSGSVDFSNKERVIPDCSEMVPQKQKVEDKFGWWFLEKGTYKIRTNETINLPNDLIAIAFPRSTLLRMGVFIQNAVWDAGFSGRSEFILVVGNPHGLRLKQNARINQLVFLPVNEVKEGYKGIYQNL
jgi:dUTP pyrophosphatase